MDGQLILVISDSMDDNKKPDRNEDALIRMSANARKAMRFDDDSVEVSGQKHHKVLKVHQSFSKDIKAVKRSGKYSNAELKQIGFVTTDIFKLLTGTGEGDKKASIGKPTTKIDKPAIKVVKTLIGCDPEFLLFDNDGNVVRANSILRKNGKIGSDGAMIEVRPDPETSPIKLVKNMKDIFKDRDLTESIRNFKWKASIYYKDAIRDYPVGGHIHLGNPEGISVLTNTSKTFLFSVLNKIMDELLSLPMIKLDGTDLGKSRRSDCQMAMGNNGYGYYGEWRPCDGRLEHRTLSGLWLMHPLIAKSVLGTAKAIADEMFGIVSSVDYNKNIFKHPGVTFQRHKDLYRSDFDKWDEIDIAKEMGCTRSSGYMADMLNRSKAKSITKTYLKKWYAKLKGMSTYNKYSEHIDNLYTILCMPNKDIKDLGFDIKTNWVEEKEFSI